MVKQVSSQQGAGEASLAVPNEESREGATSEEEGKGVVVRYVGSVLSEGGTRTRASIREIRKDQWESSGVSNQDTALWTRRNNYELPQDRFTSSAIDMLQTFSDFELVDPDKGDLDEKTD